MTISRMLGSLVTLSLAVLATGCGEDLSGAGATFPAPLYKKWIGEYVKTHPDIKIDYSAIGSGGGIKSITDKTVHFAGSDAPLKDEDFEKLGGADAVVEFPSVAGAVVITYNLPEVDVDLKLTGELVADIYLGEVTRWNDQRIKDLNPDVNLPDTAITPVYRTDGSGTNYVFTKYLSTQSEKFKSSVGSGKQVQWKVGQGGKGNQGVTAAVTQTKGAMGYVEHGYAQQNSLPAAAIRNRDGAFVLSSPETVAAAGAGASDTMEGNLLTADIWNQPGADSYPIAAFTYLIVYADLHNLPDKEAAQHLVDFLWWVTHDGQKFAADMDYAPLAEPVQKKVEAALKTLTYKGEALKIGE